MSLINDIHNDLEQGAARLVAEYRARLCKDAFELCGNAVEAEDLAFQTFERAIQKIDTFRSESSLYAWMKTILVNLHRSSVRPKAAKGVVLGGVDEEIPESVENLTSEERILNASDSEVVRKAIEGLSPDMKEAIVLHYFMEQPVAKMAKLLMLPEGTVKFRLHAARKALAKFLSKQLNRPVVRLVFFAFGLSALAGTIFLTGRTGILPVQDANDQDDLSPVTDEDKSVPPPDIFDANQEGEANMIMAKKMASIVGASLLTVASPGVELMSERTFVFLRPETSSFWNTATNSTMTVPVDFPPAANAATLTVTGLDYRRQYSGLTKADDSFTFDLPNPTKPSEENVYVLTLAFDDGTTRTAKLGLIQGLSPDSEGTTRCLAPANGRVWNKATKQAVLPIPYGTTSFSVVVNGEPQTNDTGLDGAQGWYAMKVRSGETVSLSMIANELNYSATLLGLGDGFLCVVK